MFLFFLTKKIQSAILVKIFQGKVFRLELGLKQFEVALSLKIFLQLSIQPK